MIHSNDCTEAMLERMKHEPRAKAQGTGRLIKDRDCVPHCLKLETVQGVLIARGTIAIETLRAGD